MTNAGSEGTSTSEDRLYRKEAVEYQRYRFIGEPLRIGHPSLRPVGVGVLMAALTATLLAAADHRPRLEGELVASEGNTAWIGLKTDAALERLKSEGSVELRRPSGRLGSGKIIDRVPGTSGAGAMVRLRLEAQGRGQALTTGPVDLVLPKRSVIGAR